MQTRGRCSRAGSAQTLKHSSRLVLPSPRPFLYVSLRLFRQCLAQERKH